VSLVRLHISHAAAPPSTDDIHRRIVALRRLQAEIRGVELEVPEKKDPPEELTEHQKSFRYGLRQHNRRPS
jgi:hypothetical protein